MTSEIVRSEGASITRRGTITAEMLREEREQRQLLGQYVKECMVEGQDFGKIPGTDKPTLLKPGAEKIIDIFNCTPEFHLVPEFSREDFAAGFFKYTFRCRILNRATGAVLAEGYGSANSREQRYRWRTANRKCPNCQAEAIIQGKAEWGGGWVCFKKKGGCGSKFTAEDNRITSQPTGRVENEDIADLDNTILKMAKKRAQVDGAIALSRCSDMFTQDAEDLGDPPDTPGEPPPAPRQPSPSASESKAAPPATPEPEKKRELPEVPSGQLGFDPWKGRKIADMTADEVARAIQDGEGRISTWPTAFWAGWLKRQVDALKAEKERRAAELDARASEPARDDDVPF